jgi:hypothetical protein
MGLPVNPPPTLAASGATGGALSAGAYLWAYTYVGNFGETGLSGAAGFTATANQAGSLTAISIGPAGTVSRNIYRTKVGGSVFFYVGNVGDNSTTTFTDTVADIGLGGAPSQFFQSQGEVQATFVMFDDQRPIASANYGLLNLGPGPWDGTTSGFFAGSSSGTALAINLAAGHTGSFFDCQAAGVSLISANLDGLLAATSAVASHFGGLATAQKAGTPADSDFSSAPPNGTLIVDSTGSKIWARVGGAWKGVAIA